MGRFSDIGNAKYSGGGVYLKDGSYRVQITEVRAGTARDGYDFFVVEFKIIESDNAERKPGMICTWFVALKKDTPALGNVKQFVSLASLCPIDEVDEPGCELIVSNAQPLAGTHMRVAVTTIKTKKKQSDFSLHKWSTDDGLTQIVPGAPEGESAAA
jgi:hypothetical protein